MKAQCERLLSALRQGPLTTGEIRGGLGIGMPATRVFELKQAGYDIRTEPVKVANRFGQSTRVARYTLIDTPAEAGLRAA